MPSGESRPPRQVPQRAAAPVPAPAPVRTAPAPKPAPAPAAAAKPAKKGRSKPVLLAVAAGGVVVVAYGAGLWTGVVRERHAGALKPQIRT